MSYYLSMKYFEWNEEKNIWLKAERDLGFEDVIVAIQQDKLLETTENLNKDKYQNQQMYIVEINSYAYLVPFVEDEEKIFLKTIIPSRKATKKYLIDKS